MPKASSHMSQLALEIRQLRIKTHAPVTTGIFNHQGHSILASNVNTSKFDQDTWASHHRHRSIIKGHAGQTSKFNYNSHGRISKCCQKVLSWATAVPVVGSWCWRWRWSRRRRWSRRWSRRRSPTRATCWWAWRCRCGFSLLLFPLEKIHRLWQQSTGHDFFLLQPCKDVALNKSLMRFRSSHRNHPGAGQQATQDREASTNAHSDENPGMEDVQELLCQDWVALVRKGDHFIIFHHVAGNHLTFLPKSLRYRQKMISGPTIKSKCFTPHTSKHMLRTSKQSKQIFKPHPVCP